MGYHDKFRFGVHAVITDESNRVLQLKSTYGDKQWVLPGGGVDPGETIHQALLRECLEELGCNVSICYLSGVYYHQQYDAHACVFRCALPEGESITLSGEHSEFKFFSLDELSAIQQQRVMECLQHNGEVKSAAFLLG